MLDNLYLYDAINSSGRTFAATDINSSRIVGENSSVTYINANCLTADGTDDYVTFGNLGYTVDTTATTLSTEFYMKRTATYNAIKMVYSKSSGSTECHITASGGLRFITSNDVYWDTSGTTLSANIEYHVEFNTDSSGGTANCSINSNNVYLVRAGVGSSTTPLTISLNDFQLFARGATLYNAASLWGVKIAIDGQVKVDVPMACGSGVVICNRVSTTYVGQLKNFNLTTCWNTKQNSLHSNLVSGFTLASTNVSTNNFVQYENIYVDARNKDYDCTFYCHLSSTSVNQVPVAYQNSNQDASYRFIPYYMNNSGITNAYFGTVIGNVIITTGDTMIHKVRWTSDKTNYRVYLDDVLKVTQAIPASNLQSGMTIYGEYSNAGRSTVANSISGFVCDYKLYEDGILRQYLKSDHDGLFVNTVTGVKLLNRGTMPIPLYITNSGSTTDVFGNVLTHPSGSWNNCSESRVNVKSLSNSGLTAIQHNGINSSSLYTTSSQAYGQWIFTQDTVAQSSDIAFVSSVTTPNTNSYLISVLNQTTIQFRRYVASSATVLYTYTASGSTYSTYRFEVTRNQTDNQYFTGVTNTFRIRLQGEPNYNIGSSNWNTLTTVTDSSHTACTYSSISPSSKTTIFDFKFDGVRTNFNTWLNTSTKTWYTINDNMSFNIPHISDGVYSRRNGLIANKVDRFVIYNNVQENNNDYKCKRYTRGVL